MDGLEGFRPGLYRRGTGPPKKEDREPAGNEDGWELSNLRDKAEEAVAMLTDAVAATGDEGTDFELRHQLSQLNLPTQSIPRMEGSKPKSNLHLPHPPNLPLALLRLMDVYALGLAEIPAERGGWSEAKRERLLAVVKDLSVHLGEAERLSASESNRLYQPEPSVDMIRSSTAASHPTPIPSTPHLPCLPALLPPLRRIRVVRRLHHRHRGMVFPRTRSAYRGSRRCLWCLR